MSEFHTCRLCGNSGLDFMLRYGIRHYAHVRCLHKAYTTEAFTNLLQRSPRWSLGQIPYFEAKELGILTLLRSLIGREADNLP